MDPLLYIATARQSEMQAAAANERLAARLRRSRPARTPFPLVSRAIARVRDTSAAAVAPAPCPTC